MRILCLADLHRSSNVYFELKQQNAWLRKISTDVDVVVIAGDVYEACERRSPYKDLHKAFEDESLPVICVLGNHEFINKSVEHALTDYREMYNPTKYNVHYLDIIGHYDFEMNGKSIRFIGNVLWYDGSMSTVPNQDIKTFANGNWLDRLIVNFDWMKENEKCVQQIKDNISDNPLVTNILVTHCVPHYELNLHYMDGSSPYNAYSGVHNLFNVLNPADENLLAPYNVNVHYCICGHTHKRTIGKVIHGCNCINVGNDYYPPYEYYVLEI